MSKQYDLEERTFQFAKNVSLYIKKFSRTISNADCEKYTEDGIRLFNEAIELKKIISSIIEKTK